MRPFGKILIPVDFSFPSKEAMELGADIARRYDASVELIHVFEPVNYSVPEAVAFATETQLTELLQSLEKQLETARKDAEAAGAPRTQVRLLRGEVAQQIVACADAGGHDLIVMGTHGRTGIKHALLGSVAEKVVRSATCPVLTARTKGDGGV